MLSSSSYSTVEPYNTSGGIISNQIGSLGGMSGSCSSENSDVFVWQETELLCYEVGSVSITGLCWDSDLLCGGFWVNEEVLVKSYC